MLLFFFFEFYFRPIWHEISDDGCFLVVLVGWWMKDRNCNKWHVQQAFCFGSKEKNFGRVDGANGAIAQFDSLSVDFFFRWYGGRMNIYVEKDTNIGVI